MFSALKKYFPDGTITSIPKEILSTRVESLPPEESLKITPTPGGNEDLTGVYLYSEDSKLLGSYLSTVDGTGNFLEIGFGNGGNLLSIAKRTRFETIAGTDIMKLDPVPRRASN